VAPVIGEQRAIVVGGAAGIGAACARSLVDQRWSVLVADRRSPEDDAAICASAIVDVRDALAVQRAVDELADDRPVRGLVYAAGVGHVAPVDELSPERWQLVLDVNLTGGFYAARAALRHMSAGGSFVFISSVDSEAPVSGLAHYCASKAGLEALSRSLALELGPRGIRSNVVAPGVVSTQMMAPVLADPDRRDAFVRLTPLGVIAVPAQVAAVVCFLMSDAAAHVTGTRVAVDGGMSLREHPSMLSTTERTR
jgi:NAD(P)-dependent dehydrogenase (short-subunit alcohol dehydrogenase family)